LLDSAVAHERNGAGDEALRLYQLVAEESAAGDDRAALSEALRRMAVVLHHRSEGPRSRELCERSLGIATEIGDDRLAAESLNTLAGFDLETGRIDSARQRFLRALALGGDRPELRGRVEQNLGILANVRGDHAEAEAHYTRSLEAFELLGDERGRALAYHNLGMVHSDRAQWSEADRFFRRSLELATALGDVRLAGLCRLNHAEVHLGQQHYDRARESAEAALAVFNELGASFDKADAYRVIGRVFRETGRPALAEARLRAAIDLAVSTGSVLSEAETSRELALLYQATGRNQDALRCLNTAHRLFLRLDARLDLVDVAGKMQRLEDTFLLVVRDWGQSIESADSYTYGHCERVAEYGVAVARELGLDPGQLTTIRLGAYLHDLGKVKIPHEILNKPGRLTDEEFAVIQKHPEWGIELLATVEFPWDLKPIIRSHHERYDGTGYPDRLKGDEIPLGAQIICIVDVYDALTTTRSYRPAMTTAEALSRMGETRHWWRPDVFEAFLRALGEPAAP
jgi:putative nucleotidyltransferase with HDIG domain